MDQLRMLTQRRDQYKMAAMRAKSGGYGEMTMKYLRTAKVIDWELTCTDEKITVGHEYQWWKPDA